MKLEYIATCSSDCPLIRLYDFTPTEAAQLGVALAALASGSVARVEIHRLAFVESIAGCQLALVRRPFDKAIVRLASPAVFECGFTADTWDNVAGLVEPFAEETRGFQWLAGTPGDARLLLSASRCW